MADGDESSIIVLRAGQWTLVLGLSAALFTAFRWGWRAGAGVAAGALLSWVSFRWLKSGILGLTAPSTENPGASASGASKGLWFQLLGRYFLIAAGLGVILFGLHWPAIAVVSGLFASVAGVLAALISHLILNLRGT